MAGATFRTVHQRLDAAKVLCRIICQQRLYEVFCKSVSARPTQHISQKVSRESPKRSKNFPQRRPRSVLDHLGSTQGAPERCRGRLGGPSGAKRGQHGPTLGQLDANLGSKGGPHEPKRDLRETIQGSRGPSESDFWEAVSKKCVLLQTCVFLQGKPY